MATADRLEREAQKRNPWPYLDKALAIQKQEKELISPYEDFSTNAPVEQAELDQIDTSRELNRAAMRADERQKEGAAYGGSMYDYYAEESGYSPGQVFLDTQARLTKNWRELGQPRDLDDLRSWSEIMAQAEAAGIEVSKEDVQNVIDWLGVKE